MSASSNRSLLREGRTAAALPFFLLSVIAITVLALLVLSEPARTGAESEALKVSPLICDLHSHNSIFRSVPDSGSVPLDKQIEPRTNAGYSVSFWTPHSSGAAAKPGPLDALGRLLSMEPLIQSGGHKWYQAIEYHVENGPNMSTGLGGNNNHLGLLGLKWPIEHALPYSLAIALAQGQGAVAVVHHPGPGPLEWEPGYWDDPARLHLLDAFECFNGRLVGVSRYEDGNYRRALEAGASFAAVASTDYHHPHDPLGTATAVYAASSSLADILDAVRKGRTVAVTSPSLAPVEWTMPDGPVYGATPVMLAIRLPRSMDSITLYRGREVVTSVENSDSLTHAVTPAERAAYSWAGVSGRNRFQTSPVVIAKEPPRLPNFTLRLDGGQVFALNTGFVEGECSWALWDTVPHKGGKVVKSDVVRLKPGERSLLVPSPAPGAFVQVNTRKLSYDGPPPSVQEISNRDDHLLVPPSPKRLVPGGGSAPADRDGLPAQGH